MKRCNRIEMTWLLDTGLLFLLAVIVLEDLRQRAYHWVLLPPLLALLLFKAMWFLGVGELLMNLYYNLGLIGLLFLVVKLFLSVRSGRPEQVIDRSLGSGDLLLMVVLTPAFSPLNFTVFLTLSFLVALLFAGLVRAFTFPERVPRSVPLAGIMALTLMAVEIAVLIEDAHAFLYQDRIWTLILQG